MFLEYFHPSENEELKNLPTTFQSQTELTELKTVPESHWGIFSITIIKKYIVVSMPQPEAQSTQPTLTVILSYLIGIK